MDTHLIPDHIVETARRLERRVNERFPNSGLAQVGREVAEAAAAAGREGERIRRPNTWLRLGIALVLLLAAAGVVAGVAALVRSIRLDKLTAVGVFEGINRSQGSAVFLAGALVFLVTLERRLKKQRVVKAIHRLRSLAHVIDMHQLTKDPEVHRRGGTATASSPKRTLSPFLLNRYLDYCTELLAILSKISHLYIQDFPEPGALEAVESLENLTTGLSRNIWQKIMILDRALADEPPAPTPTAGPAAAA